MSCKIARKDLKTTKCNETASSAVERTEFTWSTPMLQAVLTLPFIHLVLRSTQIDIEEPLDSERASRWAGLAGQPVETTDQDPSYPRYNPTPDLDDTSRPPASSPRRLASSPGWVSTQLVKPQRRHKPRRVRAEQRPRERLSRRSLLWERRSLDQTWTGSVANWRSGVGRLSVIAFPAARERGRKRRACKSPGLT